MSLVKRLSLFFILVVLLGCQPIRVGVIKSSERGLVFTEYNELTRVIDPGYYRLTSEEDKVVTISVAERRIAWWDDNLRTSDQIQYSMRVLIIYHRAYTAEDLVALWERYPAEVLDDLALDIFMSDLTAVAAKLAAAILDEQETFSLYGLEILPVLITERLAPVMEARGCVLDSVGIQDMSKETIQ